jgi:sortase A
MPEPGYVAVVRVLGGALTILAVAALAFAAQLSLVGALSHARAQKVAYASFRASLAQATAPVGHVDEAGAPLAPGTPIAVLTIDRIGMREVIDEGTSGSVLADGPGHRRDSVLPGQAGVSVLMGRRAAYGGPFARIGELRGGDDITVVTGQGEQKFRVIDVRRAGDPQPPVLGQNAGRLTLVTADGPAYLPTDVLRVDADLTSPVQQTPRLAIRSAVLPRPEQAMGIDGVALVPLILFGQLLVAAVVGVVWIRQRLSRWHAWLIGMPVLALIGALVADQGARLLPNLL